MRFSFTEGNVEEWDNSNRVLNKLERMSGIPRPTNIDEIENWSFNVLSRLAPSILGQAKSQVELLVEPPFYEIEEVDLVRVAPTWIGTPSGFFQENARDGKLTNVKSAGLKFYKLPNISFFWLGELGAVFLSSENKVIAELSTPYYPLMFLLERSDFDSLILEGDSAKLGLVLFDRFWEINYAHWLLDLLPRLKVLDLLDKSDLCVITSQLRSSWQKNMLASYLDETIDVLDVKQFELYKFRSLVVANDAGRKVPHPSCKGNPEALNYINQGWKEQEGLNPARIALIVTRKGSRELLNTLELVFALQEIGLLVSLIDCSTVSISDQRVSFKKADVVVACHGAALGNVAFMKEGSIVVELLPPSYANPAFWIISSGNNLNYIGITDVEEEDSEVKPRLRNITLKSSALSQLKNKLCDFWS